MRTSFAATAAKAALVNLLFFSPLAADSKGIVSFELEMGGPSHQTYACVFSGVVTCDGKACAGAHIHADLTGSREQATSETVEADEKGRYVVKVALDGGREEETVWRLTAKPATITSEPFEVAGRLILMDETTILIDRPIRIEKTGV